ncbi:hypothetical protein [Mesorhizobium sp. L-2-11]|uniref:hypothetical protein n=1 Tax=Mesorhizobium sp. L-2-11 TaxID=2744521 RepID=UPI0018EA8959|nr:hypothetical protein [Mesorhizobium sp. L-2-11]BCH20141.1 hypothetical protein MesoLjLa_69920 [Mesorhizobium sp. L-2-11]
MHGTRKAPAQIERVTLTPEMAFDLLNHNQQNRPLQDRHVNRIASQIMAGKWKFNGDTIKISDTGDVLDGQHRLFAVIEAKTAVETVIIRGVARDAFSTIDTIRAVRSGADVLAINGASRYRTTISSALMWLIRWQRGCLPKFRDPRNKIENSDIEAAWAAHPDMEKAVERAMQLRGLGNPAVFAFVYYVMGNLNEAVAERMMETLEDPAGVPIDDPFYALRAWLLSENRKRREPLDCVAVIIKAANAAAKGRKVKVLSWKQSGQSAEAFPTLGIVKTGGANAR